LHESVHTLSAENAQLKAALKAGSPALPDVPMADIAPPAEWRGETYAGPQRGPDDPPRRSPPVIDGVVVRKPSPPPGRVNGCSDVPPSVRDTRPQNEPWRDYVEPDGSIRTSPRGPGRYWGPV
jgi:hypothetical protein